MNDTRFIQGARTSIENAVASEQKLGHGIANIFNKTISPGDGGLTRGLASVRNILVRRNYVEEIPATE